MVQTPGSVGTVTSWQIAVGITEAAQSSNPAPATLSGPTAPISTAPLISRELMGPTGEAGAPIASRIKASHAAAWGAAAEVPLKKHCPMNMVGQVPLPKPPAPLIETASAAVQVGPGVLVMMGPATPAPGQGKAPGQVVVRPSCTGPPLLKPSSIMEPAPKAADDVARLV